MSDQNLKIMKSPEQERRNFLVRGSRTLAAVAAIGSVTTPVQQLFAAEQIRSPRTLRFFNTHTGEEEVVDYRIGNTYNEKALVKLNTILRDHRANESIAMDNALFDQLWSLQQIIQSDEYFEIISGYRSKSTNDKLRKRSSGVARNSYHLYGRAIDFRLRGTKISTVRKVALMLKAGGVGYYPKSSFVHIDTGPVRNWS